MMAGVTIHVSKPVASNGGLVLWVWNMMLTCPTTIHMGKRLSYQHHGLTVLLMWDRVLKGVRKISGQSFANMQWSLGLTLNT